MVNKSAMAIRDVYGNNEDRYIELVRRFPLRPLRNDKDLDAAIIVIDDLLNRHTLVDAEHDYLEVLGDLVESFESKAVPIQSVGDSDMLRFLIEQNRSTQTMVASGAGIAESTISKILAGKRFLNRDHIVKLARYFSVSPAVFFAGVK